MESYICYRKLKTLKISKYLKKNFRTKYTDTSQRQTIKMETDWVDLNLQQLHVAHKNIHVCTTWECRTRASISCNKQTAILHNILKLENT